MSRAGEGPQSWPDANSRGYLPFHYFTEDPQGEHFIQSVLQGSNLTHILKSVQCSELGLLQVQLDQRLIWHPP